MVTKLKESSESVRKVFHYTIISKNGILDEDDQVFTIQRFRNGWIWYFNNKESMLSAINRGCETFDEAFNKASEQISSDYSDVEDIWYATLE